MPNDIPSTAVQTERFYETIEMPAEIAKLTDEQLYSVIATESDHFKKAVARYCFMNGLGEFERKNIEVQKAAEVGLVLYKGIWIAPVHIIPNRFKNVIDGAIQKTA